MPLSLDVALAGSLHVRSPVKHSTAQCLDRWQGHDVSVSRAADSFARRRRVKAEMSASLWTRRVESEGTLTDALADLASSMFTTPPE